MCNNPIYAVRLCSSSDTGKDIIKILPKRLDCDALHILEDKYGKDRVFTLPCGTCLSCLTQYSRDWAVRCMLESSYYKYNWFVTLTYDNNNLPSTKEEARKDIDLFLKRLRSSVPGVRYFGSFEKGERSKRPHFHLILFNCPLEDLIIVGKRKNGYLWKSPFLFSCWKKGLIDIGTVTFESCGYVARYVIKKRVEKDPDEFIMMSRMPGIGQQWFMDHIDDVAKYGKIVFNFGTFKEAPLPRYFDKLLEKYRPEALEHLKNQRSEFVALDTMSELTANGFHYREENFIFREQELGRKLNRLKRRL